jgi:hypothetical protein
MRIYRFQVYKGACENSMKPFGGPVMTSHEATLMMHDDREKSGAASSAEYAIVDQAENRVLVWLRAPRPVYLERAA